MSSAVDLSYALPELIFAEGRMRLYANQNGIDYRFAPYGGVRTEADTAQILAFRATDYAAARAAKDPTALRLPIEQWRPIAPFGQSFHNFGAAFDILITKFPGYPTADDALQDLKNASSLFGLRSNVVNDPGHFELAISLQQARLMWSQLHEGLNGDAEIPGLVPSVGTGIGLAVLIMVVLLLVSRRGK